MFYPKIQQRIISNLSNDNFRETGKKLAEDYLGFPTDWKFNNSGQQPLQTIQSFIIILTGCETAQRVNEKSITFVLMDAGKTWDKEKIKEVLSGGLDYLKEVLGSKHELAIEFIDILGEREIGKCFCVKCGMYFEFVIKREFVTCSLMAQKCVFDPQYNEKVNYYMV